MLFLYFFFYTIADNLISVIDLIICIVLTSIKRNAASICMHFSGYQYWVWNSSILTIYANYTNYTL